MTGRGTSRHQGRPGTFAAPATSTRAPKPALATLCHEPFFDDGWIYERKLDGERCLAVVDGTEVRLVSRSGRDVTASFPEIAEALAEHVDGDGVLDGEVVAFEGFRTSFARLQPRIHLRDPDRARDTGVRVHYYLFDVLSEDGEDTRDLPLLERKRRLRRLVRFEDPLRYTPHRVHADPGYLASACESGWEGLIAKRADAPYASSRTDRWLKFKCEAGQELVVVGFTDPEGSRPGLGALLLGYHRGDDLEYAGKVGTGFDDRQLVDLRERLEGITQQDSPCTTGRPPERGVHWVRPEVVAEVAFTEWTDGGRLRHPRFLGLRRDKDPRDVVRE